MADRNALGRIGMIFCAATVAVITIGGVVVGQNLNGRYQFDDSARVSALTVAAAR
jgi:hypothetical protein